MRGFGRVKKAVMATGIVSALLLSPAQSVYATSNGTVTISMVGKYDSADTAAIRAIDTEKKQIRFRNHETGKTYTLDYDNTSMMYDGRGVVMSPQLLEEGQVVDVTFLKSTKHITTLNVSNDAWVIDSTRDHELVRNDGTARIKDEIYRIDPRTLVLADGEPAIAENVLSTDRIKVSGIGKEIYSVVVTGGHGYVSLSSDIVEEQSLVGAWLELDNEVIHKISPNMLLSAPEGDYTLQILGNGANYQTQVSITRNQETVVDTSDVTITKPKEGLVTFEIVPESAEVFVDGKKVLTGTPQSVQYGYHSLKIMADGYITQNRYLKVGTAKSVVSIELEKDESSEDSSSKSLSVNNATVDNSSAKSSLAVKNADVSSSSSKSASAATTASTVSSNSASESTNKVIEGYYIYFDEPEDAELYFDGSYIGIIPTKVQKISGNHEIILKRDGYKTKSYRIKIDKTEDNVTYEFPDMTKEDDDSTSTSSTTSSSSSSASTSSSSASTSSASASDSSTNSSTDSSTSATTASSEASATENTSDSEVSTASSTEKASDSTQTASDAASEASGGD